MRDTYGLVKVTVLPQNGWWIAFQYLRSPGATERGDVLSHTVVWRAEEWELAPPEEAKKFSKLLARLLK